DRYRLKKLIKNGSRNQTMELIYIVIKFAAYALWCAVGVTLFRPQSSWLAGALGFGTLRLFLGVFLGVALFLTVGSMHVDQWHMSHLTIYLLMYVPLRWVEWSIMGSLLQPGAQSFFIGPERRYSTVAGALENEPA